MLLSQSRSEPFYPGYFDKIAKGADHVGVFAVTRAKTPPTSPTELGELRCDNDKVMGPASFCDWDESLEVCSCGELSPPNVYTGDHFVMPNMITAAVPLIEALPHGLVVYFELKNELDEETLIRMPHHARSIQEILRYIVEWDWAFTELGSTEQVAKTCHGIMSVINMPSSIKDFIVNTVPCEKLGRFLQGHPDARARTIEYIPGLPDDLSEWLYEKIDSCRPFGAYDV